MLGSCWVKIFKIFFLNDVIYYFLEFYRIYFIFIWYKFEKDESYDFGL